MVGTRSEFPESLDMKTGQDFVVHQGTWRALTRKLCFIGNKYIETNQIHDPRGFAMTRVNDSNNALVITPELKAFAGKVVPQCAGKNNREEFLPFNTYLFGLVNE